MPHSRYEDLASRLVGTLDGVYDDNDVLTQQRFRGQEEFDAEVDNAVCRFIPMAPEKWDSLSHAKRVPWMKTAIEAAMKERENLPASSVPKSVANAEEVPHPEPPQDEPTEPTILYHGERSYSAGGDRPKTVGQEQHNLLKLFLDRDVALDTKALNKTVANVSSVVDKLAKKFGAAVRKPDAKGDGYFIRVRTFKHN